MWVELLLKEGADTVANDREGGGGGILPLFIPGKKFSSKQGGQSRDGRFA